MLIIIIWSVNVFQYMLYVLQIKWELISTIINTTCELPYQLLKDLNLWEFKIWMKTQSNPQSHLQKRVFGNNDKKLRKYRYQNLLLLSNLLGFFRLAVSFVC